VTVASAEKVAELVAALDSGSVATAPPKSGPRWSDGTALAPGERYPLRVGERVQGKYVVERVLALGAMTVVVVARIEEEGQAEASTPPSSAKRVAIKIMRESRVTIENTTSFLADARALSRIDNRHIPKVLDVGMLPSGLPYFVMELLEGFDLEMLLARDGVFSAHVAIEHVLQACEALTVADKVGVKHNDLKPADLFLTHGPDGTPIIKLLGLGVAKTVATKPRAERTEGEDTPVPDSWRGWLHDTTLMGAPLYKAPEQLRAVEGGGSEPVDPRADVWSLGAIMFELVTGHSPFGGDTVEESIGKILERPAPALELYIANAPGGFTALIHRCLEKDRTRRFVSPGVLATKLRELVVKPSIRVHSDLQRSTYPSVPVTTLISTEVSVRAPSVPPPRARRWSPLSVVAFVIIAAISATLARRIPLAKIAPPPIETTTATASPPPVMAAVPASSPRPASPEPATTAAPTPTTKPRRAAKPHATTEAAAPSATQSKSESLPSHL
jgi:serine/threonine-protein kinase